MVVGLFAFLGFVYVPLGQKTGFEHLKAIAESPPARAAMSELVDAFVSVRARLLAALTEDETGRKPRPSPAAPEKGGPEPQIPRLGAD
jgi:hypothetical protein